MLRTDGPKYNSTLLRMVLEDLKVGEKVMAEGKFYSYEDVAKEMGVTTLTTKILREFLYLKWKANNLPKRKLGLFRRRK